MIRINARDIGHEEFGNNLCYVWRTLQSKNDGLRLPRNFQLIFLTCLLTFVRRAVDVAIIEVHVGGEYDVTNIFDRPSCTGVTSLGLDHVDRLGPGIQEVAWHKSGIFKSGVPAFTLSRQPAPAMKILKERAKTAGTDLTAVDPNQLLRHPFPSVQTLNFSLGSALTEAWLAQSGTVHHLSQDDHTWATSNAHLPCRFQVIPVGATHWYLDSAHNTMSIPWSLQWFFDACRPHATRILAFSHFSLQRDSKELLSTILKVLAESSQTFHQVFFCMERERKDGSLKPGQCPPPMIYYHG